MRSWGKTSKAESSAASSGPPRGDAEHLGRAVDVLFGSEMFEGAVEFVHQAAHGVLRRVFVVQAIKGHGLVERGTGVGMETLPCQHRPAFVLAVEKDELGGVHNGQHLHGTDGHEGHAFGAARLQHAGEVVGGSGKGARLLEQGRGAIDRDFHGKLLMRKRRAAPSFLAHLAACKLLGFGSVQAAAGQLGAAGLIPLGGADANAAGLGARSMKEFTPPAPRTPAKRPARRTPRG